MRSLVEGLAEQPQEVITRKTGLLRNLVETERVVVTVIYEVTSTIQPLERFDVCFDSSNHIMALAVKVFVVMRR